MWGGAGLVMQTYLKTWRLHKGFTQEQVGNMLEVSHTTVGRYESGAVTLNHAQLQEIAKIYGVSVSQLAAPPEEAELVAVLDEVQTIVTGMDPAALKHWLALGRSLKKQA